MTPGNDVPFARLAFLTAETAAGRDAIREVMACTYDTAIDAVPPAWAHVLLADGVPATFALLDPDRAMAFPRGDLPFAFLEDAATRTDMRGRGLYRAMLRHLEDSLRAHSRSILVTHGDCILYRRLGFEVFTHHCGIFIMPEQIERRLGRSAGETASRVAVDDAHTKPELLLVREVTADGLAACAEALREAAALAGRRGKTTILFEHPAAPSYGSRYPLHPVVETPLAELACACGGRLCLEGDDPESGLIPHADWIKVLDAAAFVREAVALTEEPEGGYPHGAFCLATEAGPVALESGLEGVVVSRQFQGGGRLAWPVRALAQMVTGYQSAGALAAMHQIQIAAADLALLESLFPRRWRFSRNESWTYAT
ncbi:MAG: GNAT family N-acetyltransferase [Anaerolineae bacterium]